MSDCMNKSMCQCMTAALCMCCRVLSLLSYRTIQLESTHCMPSAAVFWSEEKNKKKRVGETVYAVRRHDGSLCLKRQPEIRSEDYPTSGCSSYYCLQSFYSKIIARM